MRELVLRRGTTKWQTLSCEEDDSGGGGCEGMREREHDNDVATAGRVTYGDRPDQAPRLQHRRTHIPPAREDNDSGPALRRQSTRRRPNCSRWLIEATRNTHTHRSVARSRLRRRSVATRKVTPPAARVRVTLAITDGRPEVKLP